MNGGSRVLAIFEKNRQGQSNKTQSINGYELGFEPPSRFGFRKASASRLLSVRSRKKIVYINNNTILVKPHLKT